MGCNTAQKEVGGKSLILKTCKAITAISTFATGTVLTKTAHGLKVGDIVKFSDVDGATAINVNDFYYVSAVPNANDFSIAATKGGAAIVVANASSAVAADFYMSIGGMRSKSFSMSADGIDITNHDSDEWKTMLDGAGIRSLSVSGSGVYNNEELFQLIQTKFLANSLTCMMLIDTTVARIWEGCFKITSLEVSGDYDGEGSFSISAESSGQLNTALLS